jgi:PBP4 family serine-type D-alanyl-D-alanine carboxypeptidase
LQLNENYVDLRIIPPDTVEGEVQIVPNLSSNYYTITNNLEVVESGRRRFSIERAESSNEIVVNGAIVAGSNPFTRTPTITNPTLFYVTVLKEVLEEEGITVEGQPRDCDDIPGWNHTPNDFTILINHQSAKLKEILKVLLKVSQNLYAETMVRTLGWKETGLGSFSAGRDVVREELQAMGVAPEAYAFRDGSGLTRYNFVAPRQVADILRGMWQHEYKDEWVEALPIAGVDGTLRRRMKGTAAEGNVRAKTGTISSVRGLSGYVTTEAGENIVFSFLVNNHLRSSRATELITDDVLAMIAAFNAPSPGFSE